MPKPLEFDLLARDTFQPDDLGWLTGRGVILMGTIAAQHESGIMQVRAAEHIAAGRRGRFVDVAPALSVSRQVEAPPSRRLTLDAPSA
jgi:hypothetical protein